MSWEDFRLQEFNKGVAGKRWEDSLWRGDELGEPGVKMIRVSSSAIAAVGYDASAMRMKIRFAHGDTYDFCRVPEAVFRGLLAARSKGSYYNDHIRDRYPCH